MKKCIAILFVLTQACFFLLFYGQASMDLCRSAFSQHLLNNPPVTWIDPAADVAEAQENQDTDQTDTPQYGPVTRYLQDIKKKKAHLELRLKDNAPYFHAAAYTSRLCDRLSGKNATTSVAGMFDDRDSYADIVVELSNGAYTLGYTKTEEIDQVVEHNVESALAFAKELEDMGIHFLYMDIPPKAGPAHQDPGYQKYDGVFYDASADYAAYVRSRVEDAGISVVDMLELYPEVLENYSSYFFKTDHHWLPQTALLACDALGQALNARCGYQIDTSIFDAENYDDSVTLQWLGSVGRKLTTAYCPTEDFPILQPLYETSFSVRHDGESDASTGSMTETLFDRKLADRKMPYASDLYDVYGFGGSAELSIENHKIEDGKRLLVLRKSYADTMVPFLAASVDHMDVLDLRYFPGSLKDYIEETKPDTVVMIYGSGAFMMQDDSFDFG